MKESRDISYSDVDIMEKTSACKQKKYFALMQSTVGYSIEQFVEGRKIDQDKDANKSSKLLQ